MPEQTVWRGTSSQLKNTGAFILWGIASLVLICISIILSRATNSAMASVGPFLLLLLVVPIGIIAPRLLATRSKIYELTNERLKIAEGIFSKVTDTLELYRVKDIETRQPFLYRLMRIENVQLNTSDTSSPFVLIDAIPCNVGLGDKVRNQVETIRQQKGVREIDVE
jgi:membrane protein YdbS with pleckstrin-like domain